MPTNVGATVLTYANRTADVAVTWRQSVACLDVSYNVTIFGAHGVNFTQPVPAADVTIVGGVSSVTLSVGLAPSPDDDVASVQLIASTWAGRSLPVC